VPSHTISLSAATIMSLVYLSRSLPMHIHMYVYIFFVFVLFLYR
jgi:hypothetical protein